MSLQMKNKLSLFMKGVRKTIVRDKVAAGISVEEGKKEMSFECLKLMCKIFAEGDNPEYAFAWPFLLLEWNLIACANSVCDLLMNDVEWRDDALLLFLRKTKTDQEGREGQTPCYIYFNLCDPYLNVGLSLGLYFLKHPNILTSTTNKVFLAEFQYNRYSRILHQVIAENKEAFRRIGVEVGDIGTHSSWKGAATHAASGCTISPAMAAICNLAGWAWVAAGLSILSMKQPGINSSATHCVVLTHFLFLSLSHHLFLFR